MTAQETPAPTREALINTVKVLDHGDASELLGRVLQYLPGNYTASLVFDGGVAYRVKISGKDHFGWTLDEYVLPRLASGNIFATETR